jgi:hypothetical protein
VIADLIGRPAIDNQIRDRQSPDSIADHPITDHQMYMVAVQGLEPRTLRI